ncbi:hypothetical protein EDD36DRAFT_468072 [Exophiala viscosa]|uniref:Mtf2-like C-terminal domain-containing protein n=1 Tax=Exophiala viscosa TaxID=2486360 RepID=A0AAN6DQZ8_9EURO|nr:hypothetical protein EDD36DRAFT_468072 [Exophiala viscosa]
MPGRIEVPFLYQTRTILRRPGTTVRLSPRRCLATQSQQDIPSKDNISPSPYNAESFLKQKARQAGGLAAAPKSLPEIFDTGIDSTITATERRAFESILRLNPKQSEPVSLNDRSPYDDAHDTDVESILDIFRSSLRGYHGEQGPKAAHHQQADTPEPSAAMPQASPNVETAQRVSQTLSSQPEPDRLDETPERSQTAVFAPFPASRSSSQAVHPAAELYPKPKQDSDITERLQVDWIDEPTQQAMRKHISEIATALQAAATSTTQRGDLAMWSVCESQIFSLAGQLQDRPKQSQLIILHHVYPSALLLALRLYIKHFPSSPLAHNLLPRIRSFGHTSYVLGASPQFYNSLMSLIWQTRSTLREVDSLLSDMERGGVELNEETYRVLRLIEDERATDLEQSLDASAGTVRGSRGGAWWKRHEQMFWFPRILDWLGVVSKRLNMREIEAGRG